MKIQCRWNPEFQKFKEGKDMVDEIFFFFLKREDDGGGWQHMQKM